MPQNTSDRAMSQWHVSSTEYFSLEQRVADSLAREQCLQGQLTKSQQLLHQSEDEANRREAKAIEQGVNDMRLLYEPQLVKARQDLTRLQVLLAP